MNCHPCNFSLELKTAGAYDVLVAGGGTAGVAAAVSAARRGAKVCLVEQSSMLGGLGTSGMMTAVIAPKRYFGGIGAEIVDMLRQRGGTGPDVAPGTYAWVPYQNEAMKVLLDDIVMDGGVDLYLYTKIIGVKKNEDIIRGITLSGPDGNFVIEGKVFIDATGDGILSCYAGEDFELGDAQGKTQAPTMTAYYGNVDFDRFSAFISEEGGDYVKIIHKYVPIAVRDGVLSLEDLHHPGAFNVGEGLALVNAGHVYGADCTTAKGLTMATVAGRKLANEYIAFYRKYIPGFEKAVMTNTASWLGIRETRRIKGRYLLSYEDKKNYRKFEDGVFRFEGGAASDLHASSPSREDYLKYHSLFTAENRHDPDDYCTFPYRSLLGGKNNNLYIAGRCLSADRITHAQLRVMGYCMMMGQAAGTAASVCARGNIPAPDINVPELQKMLLADGLKNI